MQSKMAYTLIRGDKQMKILAERIREQRKIANKTQEDMAKLLMVKRATYGEYERGKNLPPIDKLKIIVKDIKKTLI